VTPTAGICCWAPCCGAAAADRRPACSLGSCATGQTDGRIAVSLNAPRAVGRGIIRKKQKQNIIIARRACVQWPGGIDQQSGCTALETMHVEWSITGAWWLHRRTDDSLRLARTLADNWCSRTRIISPRRPANAVLDLQSRPRYTLSHTWRVCTYFYHILMSIASCQCELNECVMLCCVTNALCTDDIEKKLLRTVTGYI